MSQMSDKELAELLSRYVDLLNEHGRDALPTTEFRRIHAGNAKLISLITAVDELKQAFISGDIQYSPDQENEDWDTICSNLEKGVHILHQAAIIAVLDAIATGKPLDNTFIEETAAISCKKAKYVKEYSDLSEPEKEFHRKFVRLAIQCCRKQS